MKTPRGMDFLLHVRRQGVAPDYPVWVYLDENRPRPEIYADLPLTFEISVRPGEEISRLDWRGLTGLSVAVSAPSLTDRLRALLKAIAAVRPAFIGGGAADANLIFAWHPERAWEFCRVGEEQ